MLEAILAIVSLFSQAFESNHFPALNRGGVAVSKISSGIFASGFC